MQLFLKACNKHKDTLRRARDEMYTCSAVSTVGVSDWVVPWKVMWQVTALSVGVILHQFTTIDAKGIGSTSCRDTNAWCCNNLKSKWFTKGIVRPKSKDILVQASYLDISYLWLLLTPPIPGRPPAPPSLSILSMSHPVVFSMRWFYAVQLFDHLWNWTVCLLVYYNPVILMIIITFKILVYSNG